MSDISANERLFRSLFAITKILRNEVKIDYLHAWIRMQQIVVAECEERLGEYDRADPATLLPEFHEDRVAARADYETRLADARELLAIGHRELAQSQSNG